MKADKATVGITLIGFRLVRHWWLPWPLPHFATVEVVPMGKNATEPEAAVRRAPAPQPLIPRPRPDP